MSRRGCEFSSWVKDQVITKWHKQNPGNEDVELEVHHRVAISAGKKLGIPRKVLKSPENAQAMPADEHRRYHENEPTLEEYAIIAQGLLGLSQLEFDL